MLPRSVNFEGMPAGRYFYRKLGFRPPKKGEHYLSGSVVRAWLAPNDFSTAYQVVIPTQPAFLVEDLC